MLRGLLFICAFSHAETLPAGRTLSSRCKSWCNRWTCMQLEDCGDCELCTALALSPPPPPVAIHTESAIIVPSKEYHPFVPAGELVPDRHIQRSPEAAVVVAAGKAASPESGGCCCLKQDEEQTPYKQDAKYLTGCGAAWCGGKNTICAECRQPFWEMEDGGVGCRFCALARQHSCPGAETPVTSMMDAMSQAMLLVQGVQRAPLPNVHDFSIPTGAGGGKAIDFRAMNGMLYGNGQQFTVKGVNWYGAEDRNAKIGGLDTHGLEYYFHFLQTQGFNSLRLLFNHDFVLGQKNIGTSGLGQAPELRNLEYLDSFLRIAQVAAKYDILVMMACHRLFVDSWPGNGLWYDQQRMPESRVLDSWTMIAQKLCGQWNVFAVDLQNEPHASSWGKKHQTDWNLAAERLGNHVLSVCSRWLVMVEGVGYTPGAAGLDDPAEGIWWGGNLAGARTAPVILQDQTKLVYSPHAYGPSVYMQKYFEVPEFPSNMPAIWDKHFSFVQQLTRQPIVVGELGGKYEGKDQEWQDWALGFMKERGMGLFYFCLNPDSDDTGGMFLRDWTTLDTGKMALLANFPGTDVARVRAG